MMVQRKYDLLAVGELLVDMISEGFAETLADVTSFKRIQGGSPANMCMNMARLGKQVSLAASVGKDDMGQWLVDYVMALGVNCIPLERVRIPTTLILVTRSQAVSNFEPYRGADCHILPKQLHEDLLKNTTIFHTTCFALSKNPAQKNILVAAEKAHHLGCQLSIDANYAQKIWNNRRQAQQVLAQYCAKDSLVKISEVDWERLYKTPLTDANVAADHFLKLGAKEVCVTLGSEGCLVSTAQERLFLPARKVEVKDTTGAGDAFWSGYLTAWLDGHSLEHKAMAGRRMAELKLAYFGPLPKKVEKEQLYIF